MQTTGTFDFTLRYQRTLCARYHVRPLSLFQQDILYRCDGTVTVADLSDATRCPHPEIRDVLSFLSLHGLVKTLMPEPWLFERPLAPFPKPQPAQTTGHIQRWLQRLKRLIQHRRDRFWFRRSLEVPTHL
ncbi:MAG TPA: hypothetical protein VH599_17420 [Ktedonobacterales bacterium]